MKRPTDSPVNFFSTEFCILSNSYCNSYWWGCSCTLWVWSMLESRNLKWGIGSLFAPVLTQWGGGHIDRHVLRRVIVPLDLAQSVGVICACYRYCVIHRAITCMCAWFKSTRKGNSRSTKWFGRLSYKRIWRYNNSPPYETARWLPHIFPLNFLGIECRMISICPPLLRCSCVLFEHMMTLEFL